LWYRCALLPQKLFHYAGPVNGALGKNKRRSVGVVIEIILLLVTLALGVTAKIVHAP
jgi:hypothetical protein